MSIKLVPFTDTEFKIICEAGTYSQWNEEDRVLFYGEYSDDYGRPVLTDQADLDWLFDSDELRQIADLLDQAYPTTPTRK